MVNVVVNLGDGMFNEEMLVELQKKAARWEWFMNYVMSDEIRYDAALRACNNVEEVAVVIDRAIEEQKIDGVYEESEEST